jgi:hypothetical protein
MEVYSWENHLFRLGPWLNHGDLLVITRDSRWMRSDPSNDVDPVDPASWRRPKPGWTGPASDFGTSPRNLWEVKAQKSEFHHV